MATLEELAEDVREKKRASDRARQAAEEAEERSKAAWDAQHQALRALREAENALVATIESEA
jgi:hypothetical protein